MKIVFDTSVIVKGFIEPRRRKQDYILNEQIRIYKLASSLLNQVSTNKIELLVPSIALVEIAAVGSRLTGKEERGIEAAEFVKENSNIIDDDFFLHEAIKIAAKTKISGFDSVFITCAKLTNSDLITDDKKMYNAAIDLGIEAKLLREME